MKPKNSKNFYLLILFICTNLSVNSQTNSLKARDTVYSPNKIYALTMQDDSNLCVYKNKTEFKWCTMSHGNGPNAKALIENGKFILKNSSGNNFWTLTGINNAHNFSVNDKGDLIVLDKNNKTVWSSLDNFSTAFDYESDYKVKSSNCKGAKGITFTLSPMEKYSFTMDNNLFGLSLNAKSNPKVDKYLYNIETIKMNNSTTNGKFILLMNGDIKMQLITKSDSIKTVEKCNYLLRSTFFEDEEVVEDVVTIADRDNDSVEDSKDKCPNRKGEISNNGCPKITPEIIKTLNDYGSAIEFNIGRATIKDNSTYSTLNSIILLLKEYPNSKIEIGGHTGLRGSTKLQQNISNRRAHSVLDYLSQNGIDIRRLTAVGYGKTKPKVLTKTKASERINNRIEFKLIK